MIPYGPSLRNKVTPQYAYVSPGDYYAPAAALAAGGAAAAIANRMYKKQAKAKQAKNAKNNRIMSSAPVSVGMKIKRPRMSVKDAGADSKVVSASEVIFSNITSTDNGFTGGSQVYEMLLNPLHPAFKILSDEAKNFQLFRFKKAHVVFESTCNSTITGAVGLGQLSDVLDNSPNDYESFALLKDTIQANVWQSCRLPLSLDNSFRYVSYGDNDVTSAEIRQVNQAKIFFCLINTLTSSGAVGNIKLEYTVELSKRVNGDPLSTLDWYGYLVDADASILSNLTSMATVRRTPYFQIDGTKLRLLPRGQYILNMTIAVDGDEDIVGPASSILPYTYTGSVIPTTVQYSYAGYTDTSFTNQNLFTTMARFVANQPSGYIDFQPLVDAALANKIDINLTIDIIT